MLSRRWRFGIPSLYWLAVLGTYVWPTLDRHHEFAFNLVFPWCTWLGVILDPLFSPGWASGLLHPVVNFLFCVVLCGGSNAVVLYGLLSVEWRQSDVWSRPGRMWRIGIPSLYWLLVLTSYIWAIVDWHHELAIKSITHDLTLPWCAWLFVFVDSVLSPGWVFVFEDHPLAYFVFQVFLCGGLNAAILYGLLSLSRRRTEP